MQLVQISVCSSEVQSRKPELNLCYIFLTCYIIYIMPPDAE